MEDGPGPAGGHRCNSCIAVAALRSAAALPQPGTATAGRKASITTGKPLDTVWDAAAPCSEASFLSVSQARVTDASECSGRCTQAKDNFLAMMVKLCTRYV